MTLGEGSNLAILTKGSYTDHGIIGCWIIAQIGRSAICVSHSATTTSLLLSIGDGLSHAVMSWATRH
jgi:hypothetical protein